jgi:AraC-like DNA-binding protein
MGVDNADIFSTAPFAGASFPLILGAGHYADISSVLREIFTELRDEKAGYRDVVRSLCIVLFARLHRRFRNSGGPRSIAPRPDLLDRLLPALQHTGRRYDAPISLDKLAVVCHMSRRAFTNAFRAALGLSPMQYLNRLRLSMAAARLRTTDEAVSMIALDCGFATLSSFNRLFRQRMKVSPREWRKEGGSGGVEKK